MVSFGLECSERVEFAQLVKHCDCNETIARFSNLAPYVTVWLLREKEKPEKRSTPKPSGDSRRFSIAPVFDEAFFFEISPSELSTSNVVVSVINHQLIFKVTYFEVMNCGINGESNTEIGYCVLGELGIDEAGKEHWREAIGQPGRIITQWHGLMAE